MKFKDNGYLKFMPNSNRPFKEVDDPDPLAVEYHHSNFPIEQAATQIFIEPFAISSSLIFEGMQRLLSTHFYNSTSDYHGGPDCIDLNTLLSGSFGYLNIHDWKDNSEFDKHGRIFWRVVTRLGNEYKFKIYKKVTGFDRIVEGGFGRLPKTKIIVGKSKEMFPEPFSIIIDPDFDENMLEKELIMESKS